MSIYIYMCMYMYILYMKKMYGECELKGFEYMLQKNLKNFE